MFMVMVMFVFMCMRMFIRMVMRIIMVVCVVHVPDSSKARVDGVGDVVVHDIVYSYVDADGGIDGATGVAVDVDVSDGKYV